MHAFPTPLSESEDRPTGLSCPDCFGVLSVRIQGDLQFRCRIGHTYSLDEVIKGKEHLIEQYLWSAVTALEELVSLLREVGGGARAHAFAERARTIDDLLAHVRAVIADNAPTVLGADEGGS